MQRKTALWKKSKYSSWNKVLPIWSNHLIALGKMPVLGQLLGYLTGSAVMGQELSPTTWTQWQLEEWRAGE